MSQINLENQLYLLLKKIEKFSKKLNSTSESVSEEEANMYEYLKKHSLVDNLKIDYYYGNTEVGLDKAILTDKGRNFIKKIEDSKKPIRMTNKNRYEQIQVFLQRIEDGDKNLMSPNPRVKEDDYFSMIKYSIDKKIIENISIKYADDKPYLIIGLPRITTEGYDILEHPYEKLDQMQKTENNYYVDGDSRGSTFGSDNIQNNN